MLRPKDSGRIHGVTGIDKGRTGPHFFHSSEFAMTTRETMPWHIWLHEVQMMAIIKGSDRERVMAVDRARLQRAYQAGEPLWMAADVVKQLVRGAELAEREVDDGRDIIRRAAACGVIVGSKDGFGVFGGSK